MDSKKRSENVFLSQYRFTLHFPANGKAHPYSLHERADFEEDSRAKIYARGLLTTTQDAVSVMVTKLGFGFENVLGVALTCKAEDPLGSEFVDFKHDPRMTANYEFRVIRRSDGGRLAIDGVATVAFDNDGWASVHARMLLVESNANEVQVTCGDRNVGSVKWSAAGYPLFLCGT